jgi:CheY-like chemotaxis protein
MPTRRTILLVDDDPLVRNMLAEHFRSNYEVLLAGDGVEAVYLFENNADQVAAVVTDLEMPRLNGQILEERVHHINPQLPVIIMSGAFEKYARRNLARRPMTSFLGKPFEVSQLESMLELALAADGRAA